MLDPALVDATYEFSVSGIVRKGAPWQYVGLYGIDPDPGVAPGDGHVPNGGPVMKRIVRMCFFSQTGLLYVEFMLSGEAILLSVNDHNQNHLNQNTECDSNKTAYQGDQNQGNDVGHSPFNLEKKEQN